MSTIDYLRYLQYSSGELLQKIEVGAMAGRTIYLQFIVSYLENGYQKLYLPYFLSPLLIKS